MSEDMSWRNRERRQRQRPKAASERLVHKDKLTAIQVGDTVTVRTLDSEAKQVRVTAQTPEYVGRKKGDLVLIEGSFLLIEHVW